MGVATSSNWVRLPITYYAVDRWTGGGEDDPPVERLREILQELDVNDPEHPDCWLVHRETGWTLSAFSAGKTTLVPIPCVIPSPISSVIPAIDI